MNPFTKFTDRFPGNSYVYFAATTGLLILTGIVFLLPVGFSEYRSTDAFAPIWYVITITGGVYGSAVIILILTFYLILYFKKNNGNKFSALYFAGTVIIIQVLISGSTLYYFKDVFRNPRPSQLYISGKGSNEISAKEFFVMKPEEKSKYLRNKIEENKSAFEDVYPPILRSWTEESGYSFPSGHSETSFFLGTILSFVIFRTGRKKNYILLPVIWSVLVAMSRVVIGVHYPSDVAAGALIGLLIAFIVISNKKINLLFNI